jgi:hypothetical protein
LQIQLTSSSLMPCKPSARTSTSRGADATDIGLTHKGQQGPTDAAGNRIGSYRRDLVTRVGPIEQLWVPQVHLTNGGMPPAY